jgi:hypothetical protein
MLGEMVTVKTVRRTLISFSRSSKCRVSGGRCHQMVKNPKRIVFLPAVIAGAAKQCSALLVVDIAGCFVIRLQ